MDLWTEYEGRTIAGDYQLKTLLRSEGRSAFFRIGAGAQDQAVMRLTEAHFDGDEMLQRWQHVAAVGEDHLIAIRTTGQTTLDGVALTYAVLEPSDASLEEVLAERPLTAAETLEVARAVIGALQALHSSGLVHEHIEPANVLAVGETVKLRSDCVRECVIDQEFSTAEDCQQLRARDVRDLGILLLQCLTLNREWMPNMALAQPFTQAVPRAIDGSWSLSQIASALEAPAPPARATSAAAARSAPVSAGTAPSASLPVPPVPAAGAPLVPESVLHQAAAPAELAPEPPLLQPAVEFRPRNAPGVVRRRSSGVSPWVYVAGLVVLALLGWHLIGRSSPPAAAPAVAVHTGTSPTPQIKVVVKPSAAAGSSRPVASLPAAGPATHGWHVVAYTYNHPEQAAAKAAQVARRHAGLQPQVFSPSGHAPYFVALGGAMSSGAAESVLHQARLSGLPRDTFMRNF